MESGSESEAASESEGAPPRRAQFQVGRRMRLARFDGQPIGDDVSWKGSAVTRVVVLQTAGSSASACEWGEWWGEALADFGADVGVLAETRLRSLAQQTQAVRGLLRKGFIAVSHNCYYGDGSGQSPAAAGVIIAVRESYVGVWQDVAKGPLGRAVAGNLVLPCGGVVRIIGLYGVTGACLPGFTSKPEAVAAEQLLDGFVQAQARICDRNGWHAIAARNPNSYVDHGLDRWGGHSAIRSNCLAMRLQDAGFDDAFRSRHLRLRAFAFRHSSGSASRLDQGWVRAASGQSVTVLNAAIVWTWPKRRDHDPFIADLGFALPCVGLASVQARAPYWRRLCTQMEDPSKLELLRATASQALELHRLEIEDAKAALQSVCVECGRLPSGSLPDTSCFARVFTPSFAFQASPPDPRNSRLRAVVDQAHEIIEGSLSRALPTLPEVGSCVVRRNHDAWEKCIALLRVL